MKDGQDVRNVVFDSILNDVRKSSRPDNSDIVENDRVHLGKFKDLFQHMRN